jgi:hypothetical protein
MRVKTDKELIIELRNKIAGKIVENKANKMYWDNVVKNKKYKTGSADVLNAIQKVKINEDDIEKDKVFLSIIDSMI